MRRRPRAQTLLLEHGDTFEDSTRVVHHRSLGHLLRVVDEERFGADARAESRGEGLTRIGQQLSNVS